MLCIAKKDKISFFQTKFLVYYIINYCVMKIKNKAWDTWSSFLHYFVLSKLLLIFPLISVFYIPFNVTFCFWCISMIPFVIFILVPLEVLIL